MTDIRIRNSAYIHHIRLHCIYGDEKFQAKAMYFIVIYLLNFTISEHKWISL